VKLEWAELGGGPREAISNPQIYSITPTEHGYSLRVRAGYFDTREDAEGAAQWVEDTCSRAADTDSAPECP